MPASSGGHGGAGGIAFRGRTPVLGDFRDAAGISDAAIGAGFLDVDGQTCARLVTGIPSVSTLPNVVARILAFTGAGGDTFYYTTGLDGAPQMQVTDSSADFVRRGFFRYRAARRNFRGFAVSDWSSWANAPA